MRTTTVVARAIPATHANMNETLLTRARPLNSIRITAAIGIGLTAIPTA